MSWLDPSVWKACEALLGDQIQDIWYVGGGDINQARALQMKKGATRFLKFNSTPGAEALLEAEIYGLEALRKSQAIAVPKVLGSYLSGPTAFLLLEFIEEGTKTLPFWERFGRELADLHRNTHTHFGFERDNFIGRLPQSNRQHADWTVFYREERMNPQLWQALDQGALTPKDADRFHKLFQLMETLIPATRPSLLHGDLWSGNFLAGVGEIPYLFDPSVSYGHREVDLAMSRLFGGFHSRFYSSYEESFPLEPGWEDRTGIYQLYYLLVHINLFGGSYVNAARRILTQYGC